MTIELTKSAFARRACTGGGVFIGLEFVGNKASSCFHTASLVTNAAELFFLEKNTVEFIRRSLSLVFLSGFKEKTVHRLDEGAQTFRCR